MSKIPPEKPTTEPPAGTGYVATYTEDGDGVSANVFEQNCTLAGEEEMPADRDAASCGWSEATKIAPKEYPDEFRWVWEGTAKRALASTDWELKSGNMYDLGCGFTVIDHSTSDLADDPQFHLSFVKLEIVESGAYAALAAGVTALVAALAF